MWASHGKPKNLQNDWGMVWNLDEFSYHNITITIHHSLTPLVSHGFPSHLHSVPYRASFSALGDSLFCAKSSSCSTWTFRRSSLRLSKVKKTKKLLADANIKFRIMRMKRFCETPNFVNSILCISNHRIHRSWVSMSPIRTRYPKVRYSKVPTGVA